MYEVNLLPKELQPKIRWRGALIIVLLAVYLMAMLAVIFFSNQKIFHLNRDFVQLQAELPAIQERASRAEALQSQKLQIIENVKALEDLVNERKGTYRILQDINDIVPSDCFLTALKILPDSQQEDTIGLEGEAGSVVAVGAFVEKISLIEYVSDVDLLGLHEQGEFHGEDTIAFKIIARMGEGGQ